MTEVATRKWSEQVLEDHRELRAMVENLERFLEQDRPELGQTGFHTWAAELSKLLVTLHDRLFRHFRFEEEGCKVEEICIEHPEASDQIRLLMEEHPQLLENLRGLSTAALRYSAGDEPRDPALRTRVKTLLDDVSRHEGAETRLLMRLEYRDIGTGD